MTQGQLIVLEGPDGAGKSTLCRVLLEKLQERGVHACLYAFPGNRQGTLGRLVHDLHHDPSSHGVRQIDRASLQVLHAAAHIDGINTTIRPAIERGDTVVMDRFWWSTMVYGQEAGVDSATLAALRTLALHHWSFVTPVAAFVLLGRPFSENEAGSAAARLRQRYADFVQSLSEPFPVECVAPVEGGYVVTRSILDKVWPLLRS